MADIRDPNLRGLWNDGFAHQDTIRRSNLRCSTARAKLISIIRINEPYDIDIKVEDRD